MLLASAVRLLSCVAHGHKIDWKHLCDWDRTCRGGGGLAVRCISMFLASGAFVALPYNTAEHDDIEISACK